MSAARKARAGRAADAARQVEEGVKLTAFRSRHQALEAAATIETTRDRNHALLGTALDPGLRSHLLQAGIRHLSHLEVERQRLEAAAVIDQQAWDVARLRVRSLDKLVERLDTALRARHRLAENAEWQDIVTSRSTGRRHSPDQARTSSGGGR